MLIDFPIENYWEEVHPYFRHRIWKRDNNFFRVDCNSSLTTRYYHREVWRQLYNLMPPLHNQQWRFAVCCCGEKQCKYILMTIRIRMYVGSWKCTQPLFRNLDSPVSTCPISLETSLKTPRHQSFDEGNFGGIFNNATDNLDRKKVGLQRNDEDVISGYFKSPWNYLWPKLS